MKIRPVGAELFRANKQTDMTKLIVIFDVLRIPLKENMVYFWWGLLSSFYSENLYLTTAYLAVPSLSNSPFPLLFSCLIRWITNVMYKQSEQACHTAGDLFYTCNSWSLDSCFLPYFVTSETLLCQYLLPLTLRRVRLRQHKTNWLWNILSVSLSELCGNRLPECYLSDFSVR